MTKRALIVVATAATVMIAAGIWWQGPLASVLGFGGERARYLGYVEGETSLIAPPVAGRLVERPVDRGGQVKKGDRLFVIDPVLALAEVTRTEGALAESKSRYENLLKGKRQEEKDVTTLQRRETEAALAMAEIELKRQSELVAKGYSTRKDYEQGGLPGAPSCARGPPRSAPRSGSTSSPRALTRSRPPSRWSTRTRRTSIRRGSGWTT